MMFLFFGAALSVKTSAKMQVPLALEKNMADDSLLQLTNNLQEDVDEHYFDTYAGEDAEDASDEDAKYDDAFVQMSLKTHAEAMKSGLLQKEKRAPDDDEYDFAEDDDDDPADFSVGQFLDDDDDDAFIQLGSTKDDDDELADDRLGGEYILASDRDEQMKEVAEDDEEESDHEAEDALHEVLLQEARKHHKRAHEAEMTMTETKKPKKPKKPSHKAHKHPAMLGVTDVYSQLAQEEANGNGADSKGWFGGDDSDDGEDEDGYSFIQTDGKDKDADDDDDDDSLADDRLDGGMDQILAATAEN